MREKYRQIIDIPKELINKRSMFESRFLKSPIIRAKIEKFQEELEKLTRENEIMAEIGQVISSTLDIEEVYGYFVELVRYLIDFDRLAINIINPENQTFFIPYVWGPVVPERTPKAIVSLQGTATLEIFRTKSPLLVNEDNRQEIAQRFPGLAPAFAAGFKSLMMTPLFSQNEVIGVLNVQSTKPNAYAEDDLKVAQRVSNQIAGAIANALLFRRHEEAEIKIKEQLNFLWVLLDTIPNPIFYKDSQGKYLGCNRAWSEIHGLQPEEIIGKTVYDIAPAKLADIYWQKDEELFKNGGKQIYEAKLIRADGQEREVIFNKAVFYKADGSLGGIVGITTDITERKKTEAVLKRKEEEVRLLARENNILAEIARIISSTLKIEEVYENFANEVQKLILFDGLIVSIINEKENKVYFRYSAGLQIPGRMIGDSLPIAEGTAAAYILQKRSALFIQGEALAEIADHFPGLLPFKGAGIRSLIMAPLVSQDKIVGILGFFTKKANAYSANDLRLAERVANQIAGAIANSLLFEDLKKSQEALRQSEERYRSILANIEDGYYEVDLAGNFTFFNESLSQMLGYSKEEMVGLNNRQYTDEENARQIYQIFNRVYKTGLPAKQFEAEIIRKDGQKRNVELSVSLIRNNAEKPIGFRGIVRDITERKKAEKEMVELQEQLRQAQKMEAIGQLAGGIAHDFNNALTLIRTCSQLALLDLKEADPLKEKFEMINRATEQSANLTRQLLAFSRRQVMELKVVDLNNLIREMDKMLRRVIGEDIELVNNLAEDLGRVRVDPGQMEQVIINLAVNARDAMPRGGRLTIETANVHLDQGYVNGHVGVNPGDYIRLTVSDTGVGMTPEVRRRIFEPFFTTKEKGKGTGLGLSTVYGIVKQSGGYIYVYSEPGMGATFKIYLPRIDEELEKEHTGPAELPQGRETILVVEDEKDVRSLIVQILRKQGYQVIEAESGAEAFDACANHEGKISLLLTDVVMPGMSGRELAEKLLSWQPEMKVLYMSGYTDDAMIRYGVLEAGMNFMQKPFSMEALAQKVRQVLDQ